MSSPTGTPAVPGVVKANLTVLVVCGTVLAIVLIGAMTYLSLNEKSADDLRGLVNTAFNLINLILTGGAVAFARQAQTNAGVAAQQTNGALDVRIERAIARALAQQDAQRDAQRERFTTE